MKPITYLPLGLRAEAARQGYCCPFKFLRETSHLSHQQFANKYHSSKSTVKAWRKLKLECPGYCY